MNVRNFIFVLLCIMVVIRSTAQFDCSTITVVAVTDTTLSEGIKAAKLVLATEQNTMHTGYTSFVFINDDNDTIVDSGSHYWMPTIPNFKTREYALEFVPPFTNVGNDFIGTIQTSNPECYFEVNTKTNIQEQRENKNTTIYPNPFMDNLFIKSFKTEPQSYEIYDGIGRQIMNGEVNGLTKLELSQLRAGAYYMIIDGQRNLIIKI
ncbi:MAG: T9SS type A sorting domain-containing protein [Bacteroidota bacterium]